MPGNVSFRILGPLSVTVDGVDLSIRAAKQRALLSTLLLRAGSPVPAIVLVDALWGPAPPSSADHLVQVYVSDLRARLREGGLDGRLATEAAAYRFDVFDDELDARTFEKLAAQALSEAPEQAAATLATALGLWRGEALLDVPLEGLVRHDTARLDELRLATFERRMDALLASGTTPPVDELEQLAVRFPERERLAYQLMLALYRSGRQADALAAYRENRRRLVDDHGLEPGPELRELERAILRQDPALLPAKQPRVTRQRRRRATIVAAFVAVVAAGIAVTVAWRSDHDGAQVRAVADGVSIFDESKGTVIASRRLGDRPGSIVDVGAELAIGDGADRTIELVDPRTLAVRRNIGVPDDPRTLASRGSLLWIGYGYTGRIGWYDFRTGFLSREFSATSRARGAAALAPTERGLWLATQDGVLARLNPSSLHIETRTATGPFSQLIAAYGMVWGIRFRADDVIRLSARDGHVLSTTPLLGHPAYLTAGAGAIWVSTTAPDRLYRLDRRGMETWLLPLGKDPGAIAVGPSVVWVTSGSMLLHIDPRRRELTSTVELRHDIQGLADDGHGRLFVTTQ